MFFASNCLSRFMMEKPLIASQEEYPSKGQNIGQVAATSLALSWQKLSKNERRWSKDNYVRV